MRESRTGVRHGDLIDFIWVQPNLAASTLEDASGEPLLELQRDHLSLSLTIDGKAN